MDRSAEIDLIGDALVAEHGPLYQRIFDLITAMPCSPVVQTAALMVLADLAAMVITSLKDNVRDVDAWKELFDERLDTSLGEYDAGLR